MVGRVQTKHIVFCHTERMRSIQVWQIKKFSRHCVSNTKLPGFFTVVQNDNMKQNAPHFVIASETWQSRSSKAVGKADTYLYLDSSLSFRMTKKSGYHTQIKSLQNTILFIIPFYILLQSIFYPCLHP